MNRLLQKLGIRLPILQAPMAGVSTPAMAAAVTNAGGLGAIGVGSSTPAAARQTIQATKAATGGPFNVNLFCHRPAIADKTREAHWLSKLTRLFHQYEGIPPQELHEIYQSFIGNDEMLTVLLEERPRVVSFHFGLPDARTIKSLHDAGVVLLATATSLEEAKLVVDAGIDALVAQGYEAGGHRGVFDPTAQDDRLGTMALTRLLSVRLELPIIAAGGIMDGSGIAASLRLGASAAQLGTAFVGCTESQADAGYRKALFSPAAEHTVMTAAISGRPARCLSNKFTEFGADMDASQIPSYPIAYDAAKALHATAKAAGEFGYGPQWAGQGAPLARQLPAGKLVKELATELDQALKS